MFMFLTRVADVERTTIYPVYIAKHISPTILTVLEHLIQTYKKDRFYAEYQKLKTAGIQAKVGIFITIGKGRRNFRFRKNGRGKTLDGLLKTSI